MKHNIPDWYIPDGEHVIGREPTRDDSPPDLRPEPPEIKKRTDPDDSPTRLYRNVPEMKEIKDLDDLSPRARIIWDSRNGYRGEADDHGR